MKRATINRAAMFLSSVTTGMVVGVAVSRYVDDGVVAALAFAATMAFIVVSLATEPRPQDQQVQVVLHMSTFGEANEMRQLLDHVEAHGPTLVRGPDGSVWKVSAPGKEGPHETKVD